MSSQVPSRTLPENPDMRHLRDQARDLQRGGTAPTLARAQLQVARSYGFSSWTKLKAHVELLHDTGQLKAAIDRDDLESVRGMMRQNPELHRAPLGYGGDGPLTWAAECRIPHGPPSPARLAIAKWMIENGSDVHQGGDGPLMRAALRETRIPMMELLVEHGADVNARWHGHYPIILAPCETLDPHVLRWLLDHGANPNLQPGDGNPIGMVVGTYSRNAAGKHACLEVLAEAGLQLPDTPAMALHRGRLDLLQSHLHRDPALMRRRFSHDEIYPASIGLQPGEGLTCTPLDGVTLLHASLEFDDLESAAWLLDHGADPNARADRDSEGFGGHTPLFHAMVSLGRLDDSKARLLLDHGADPALRATLKKQLRDTGDPEKDKMREFHDVTAADYARQYQEPAWVSQPALALLDR